MDETEHMLPSVGLYPSEGGFLVIRVNGSWLAGCGRNRKTDCFRPRDRAAEVTQVRHIAGRARKLVSMPGHGVRSKVTV